MENKNSLNTKKTEIKKDRGDHFKKVVKPKSIVKKDIVEITKDLNKGRGDSLPKEKVNPKNIKLNQIIGKVFDKRPKDALPKTNKDVISNVKHNESVSKSLDTSVAKHTKRLERKSLDKSAPVDLVSDRGYSVPKTVDTKEIRSKHLGKTVTRKSVTKNIKQHEPKSLYLPSPVDPLPDRSGIVHKVVYNKATKSKMLAKSNPIESVTKNTKLNEELSCNYDEIVPASLVTDKCELKTEKVELIPKNMKHEESLSKTSNKSAAVVKRNIVESEKHVNRLLDIDEKKKIRDKYTFRPKVVRNMTLDDNKKFKDSHVGDNNDISEKCNNVANAKANCNENTKSDCGKIDRVSNSTDTSRKRAIIKTVVAKHDATKVYKAVTFAKQKKKENTPLQIKIPVNDALPDKTSLPKGNHNNLSINIEIPKVLHSNDDKLMKSIKKPKEISDNLNTKTPKTSESKEQNWKIPDLLKPCKASKLQGNDVGSRRSSRVRKTSRSCSDRSSVKTRIIKREKRRRFSSKLSNVSLGKASHSPSTEIAKWAPSSVNKLSLPYYEAWVNTTLAAISKNTKKDNPHYEDKKLIKSFKNFMAQGSKSPELFYENYLDERYTGKIKIHHKK